MLAYFLLQTCLFSFFFPVNNNAILSETTVILISFVHCTWHDLDCISSDDSTPLVEMPVNENTPLKEIKVRTVVLIFFFSASHDKDRFFFFLKSSKLYSWN
jgi:hypothetical protein